MADIRSYLLHGRGSSGPRRGMALTALVAACTVLALTMPGCSPPPDALARRFNDILYRYPASDEPLRIKELTAASAGDIPADRRGRPVTVIVHPAYSLFFREERRSSYTEAKYDLLNFQLDNEARFISAIAGTDHLLLLVLPGNFAKESTAPRSFVTYLNTTAGAGGSVYFLTTNTWSTGALSTDTLVMLYSFLQKVGASRVMIGGGYVGRCQREFYNQLATYMDKASLSIVPELSSISPDDISDQEASDILQHLGVGDYTPVREFIEAKSDGTANVLPFPKMPGI